MTADDLTTLWIGATRYYLGRMTYAVSDYCAMLRSQWHALPESTRTLIPKHGPNASNGADFRAISSNRGLRFSRAGPL